MTTFVNGLKAIALNNLTDEVYSQLKRYLIHYVLQASLLRIASLPFTHSKLIYLTFNHRNHLLLRILLRRHLHNPNPRQFHLPLPNV